MGNYEDEITFNRAMQVECPNCGYAIEGEQQEEKDD